MHWQSHRSHPQVWLANRFFASLENDICKPAKDLAVALFGFKENAMKNAMNILYTDLAQKVGDVPHAEYPRPLMERDSYVNLNGK
jgi:hypothetical protein